MIEIIEKGECLDKVLKRTQLNFEEVNETVRGVLSDVRKNGDAALLRYAERFDNTKLTPETLSVSAAEIEQAYREVDGELLASLRRAKDNVLAYHLKQRAGDGSFSAGRGTVGWTMRPVSRAGIYVPGGTAPYPSSVLMTVLPAVAAGVPDICMATPARSGKIHPLILVAAAECGVNTIYKVGGAQAIAALAFGTETVKKADVIAGPGNIYVTVAKKEVFGYAGIDMIAGPSEILIVADETASPEYLAADLLSQAEHDKLSTAILITTSGELARRVAAEVERQVAVLPRKDIAQQALSGQSAICVVENIERALELCNQIAPEHLELCFADAEDKLHLVQNAGAVFIGNYSPEPLGDYFAGPNHVLPTSGTAKFFSVLNTLTFMKRISVIRYDREDLSKAKDDIVRLAETEGFTAHANAVKVRFGGK